ncbi:MAG: rhomboid family intramembrane serine protease [Crocinitomicaceae bacterium]
MSELNLIDRLKYELKSGNSLKTLIFINISVFVVFELIYIFGKLFNFPDLFNFIVGNTALPGTLSAVFYKPWTIFSSLFIHGDFYHIALNMLMFYFVGQLFLSFFSQRKLVLTYVLGGICGGLLHILSYNVPYLSGLNPSATIGASGAVYAFFGAILFYRPTINVRLFFGINIPFWVLALFFVVGDFASLTKLDGIAHFAHIGGFLFGMLSMVNVDHQSQFMNRLEVWVFKLKVKSFFKSKPKMKVHRNEDFRKMNDDEYREAKVSEQERINVVLDKISAGGYDSLSKAEKAFLFKIGNDKKS